MFHFLRVVAADRQASGETAVGARLDEARKAAYTGPDGSVFTPIYEPTLVGTTSGNQIAKTLRWLLPILEFVALVLVVVAEHA